MVTPRSVPARWPRSVSNGRSREDNGDYYVDETVGENSSPVVSGPMDRDAAIKFVDDRESDARQRFESLKQEMAGRAAAANLVRRDGSEI